MNSFFQKNIYIFLLIFFLFSNISCGDNSENNKKALKDLIKLSKGVIKYIDINGRLVNKLSMVENFVPYSKMVDPWGKKYGIDYKKSLLYSSGPDKKHSELRNKSWDDDVHLYFLIPYFEDNVHHSKKELKKRERKFVKRNLRTIAAAFREYKRIYKKEVSDIFEINNLVLTDIANVKDPWGNIYEYDSKKNIIFSRGKDKMHNSSKDSTWKDDIIIKFSYFKSVTN